eukprot:TRINITY_DN71747_c0_g1_i1.p1 TRINITY_DN71747_c0_g1~~TRINITY_DN71747_c0_g1_i1.p1  ORF type:complete len:147 (-),score=22.12 TRINITY_DN71747_c0_g1_i1:35-475(-)
MRILPGELVDQWNQKAPESQKVQPQDALVEVNGQRASTQEMIACLKGAGSFELLFKRPRPYIVEVSKEGRNLGLQLKYTTGTGLIVQAIQSGAIRSMELMGGVQVSDHIIAVNDHDLGPQELATLLKQEDQLQLSVLSYVSPSTIN